MELRYPASLPCPQTSEVRSKERRLMTEEERSPRQYRPLQRNDVQLESLTFMFRTFEQSAEFMRWWREDLHFGGAWFSADWPLPQGGRAVRKFVSAPSLPTFMPTVGWTLSIVAEVRGEGLADVFGRDDAPRGWNAETFAGAWTFSENNYFASLNASGGGETGGTKQVVGARSASSGRRFFEIEVIDTNREFGYDAWCGITDYADADPYMIGEAVLVTGPSGNVIQTHDWMSDDIRYDGEEMIQQGDVLGYLVDFTNPERVDVYYSRNGVWRFGANPDNGTEPLNTFPMWVGPYYPTAYTRYGGQSFRLKTTATQLAGRLPAGTIPWEDS